MGKGVGINDVAELVVSAGTTSAALPVSEASELGVSAGVSTVASSVSGPAELSVLVGPQLTPPPTFVTPTLLQWNYIAVAGFNTIEIDMLDNITGGTPCTVGFGMFGIGAGPPRPPNIIFPVSSPDQNAPHAVHESVDAATHGGLWYQLMWRWFINFVPSVFMDVPDAVIYIPEFGDPPANGGG